MKNNTLQALALLLSVTGIVLNALKLVHCWPVWLVSNVLWIAHFTHAPNNGVRNEQWAAIILNIVFFAFNLLGWWMWTR